MCLIAMAEMQQLITSLSQSQQEQTAALLRQLQTQMEQQSRNSGAALDSTGVGKPDQLTNKIADDPAAYKTWRIKLGNWISAALPKATAILDNIEAYIAEEVTKERFTELAGQHNCLEQLSAQMRATLVSMCSEEPLAIVFNGPRGAHAGLEAMRRQGRVR